MNIRHSVLGTALALALVAPSAHALGLGQLQVKSGLNQPLVAEIPIISATPGELEALDVRLASPEAFARVGLDRPLELTANLQFSVGKNSRGQPVVRVTTANKFTEPFLSFLLEADWGKGAVTREYTALIDPPYIAPAVVKPMATPSVAAAPPPSEPMPETAPEAGASNAPAAPPASVQTMPAREPEPVSVAPVAAAPAATSAPPPAPRQVAPAPRPPKPAVAAAPPSAPTPGQYGPVASGQTLWSIASSVRPDADITVNQMMLALLHANPDSFSGDNINNLKRGAVLRIPGRDEVAALSAAQAADLVHAQASAWRNARKPVLQPAEAVSQAAKPAASAPPASKPVAAATKPANARLEIVPPAGKRAAAGAQSGAAAGAGGTELRAELTQAREDLAARTAEVGELKSRVADLEQINDKQQKMIQVQDSQMKALQDRIKQLEEQQAAKAAAPVASTPEIATATPEAASVKPPAKATAKPSAPAAPTPASTPWFLNPLVLGGGVFLLLGGLVALMRRSRRGDEAESVAPAPAPAGRRISDDDALHASLAKTQGRVAAAPVPAPVPAAAPVAVAKAEPTQSVPAAPAPVATTEASELDTLQAALRAKPQDLEAHLNLLRYFHKRGDAGAYETAAQVMRLQVPSVMDPRWREAVVMGSSLLPGHPLFGQAGWNTPKFNETEAPAAPEPTPATPEPAPVRDSVPLPAEPLANASESFGEAMAGEPVPELSFEPVVEDEAHDEVDFDLPGGDDLHRHEAELMAEDEASATKIELAKAYLDIGDFDGARSMLEEVLADGSALAKSEAARILKEIG